MLICMIFIENEVGNEGLQRQGAGGTWVMEMEMGMGMVTWFRLILMVLMRVMVLVLNPTKKK